MRARCRRRARPVGRHARGRARHRARVRRPLARERLVLDREDRLLALVRGAAHLPVAVRRDAGHAVVHELLLRRVARARGAVDARGGGAVGALGCGAVGLLTWLGLGLGLGLG